MATPPWKMFETYVQTLLDLDATPASGARFHAPGDAVSNRHYVDDRVLSLMVDCKHTTAKSFSVTAKFMGQWVDKATESGRRFVLALRIHPPGAFRPRDYVVLSLDDFHELLEYARRAQ